MIELIILIVFAAALLGCSLLGFSLIPALLAALVVFLVYGKLKKVSFSILFHASFLSVQAASKILVAFVLIGLLTATWRASGTIAFIVDSCVGVFPPVAMLLGAFLLCCFMSFLTGTAFGTASTMGVICAAICIAGNIPLFLVGGAVLSGSYFGDRCSPLSTSALLVGSLTKTKVIDNMLPMVKTSWAAFLITCLLYAGFGLVFGLSAQDESAPGMGDFGSLFVLSAWTIIPAVLALGLSFLRVDIRITLLVSVLSAGVIAMVIQGISLETLAYICIFGFESSASGMSVFTGGGVVSMLNVIAIVLISSCYAGIFNETGFFDGLKKIIAKIAFRIHSFFGFVVASFITSIVACNQTLSIMLASHICRDLEDDKKKSAIFLENSAVLIAPLIPWSIAAAVPLSTIGAPADSVLVAFFLYLVPLWNVIRESVRKRIGASRRKTCARKRPLQKRRSAGKKKVAKRLRID